MRLNINYLIDGLLKVELNKAWPDDHVVAGTLFVDKVTELYPYIQALTGYRERMDSDVSDGLIKYYEYTAKVVMWLKGFPYIRQHTDIHTTKGRKPGLYVYNSCYCLRCIELGNVRVSGLLNSDSEKDILVLLCSKAQYLNGLRNFLRVITESTGLKEVTYKRYILNIGARTMPKEVPTYTNFSYDSSTDTGFTTGFTIDVQTGHIEINDR